MDGTKEHYVTRNKPSTGREIKFDLAHVECLKNSDLMKVKSLLVVPRGGGGDKEDRMETVD